MSRVYETCKKCGNEYELTADEIHPCLLLPPTNYEKIMAKMTIEEMAELRTTSHEYEQYGEMNYEYDNDAGTWLFFDDAINGEIEWLKEEDVWQTASEMGKG